MVASAKRTAAYRDQIEAAAERHGVDPDTLEAVIFLESAGRPDVIAGPTPESAAGPRPDHALDRDRPARDVGRPAGEHRPHRADLATRDSPAPDRSAARPAGRDRPALRSRGGDRRRRHATWRSRAERFGGEDFAVVSYHMGIGNLETVIAAYRRRLDRRASLRAALLRLRSRLHEPAYDLLQGFGDESADYLWKVLASEEIMKRYRDDPDGLAATAELATNKATMEEVFHPENETTVFEDPDGDRGGDRRRRAAAAARRAGARLGAGPRHRRARRPSSTRTRSSTGRCARRRWRRSPTWPGWSATSAGPRPRCR